MGVETKKEKSKEQQTAAFCTKALKAKDNSVLCKIRKKLSQAKQRRYTQGLFAE